MYNRHNLRDLNLNPFPFGNCLLWCGRVKFPALSIFKQNYMIVNNLTRNELLAKVYMRVLKEDQRIDTQHILWDWGCSAKFNDWLCTLFTNFPSKEPFLIAFRKDGLNAGTTEEVKWAEKYFGKPYLTLRIDKGPLRYSITEI